MLLFYTEVSIYVDESKQIQLSSFTLKGYFRDERMEWV